MTKTVFFKKKLFPAFSTPCIFYDFLFAYFENCLPTPISDKIYGSMKNNSLFLL